MNELILQLYLAYKTRVLSKSSLFADNLQQRNYLYITPCEHDRINKNIFQSKIPIEEQDKISSLQAFFLSIIRTDIYVKEKRTWVAHVCVYHVLIYKKNSTHIFIRVGDIEDKLLKKTTRCIETNSFLS